MSVIKRLLFRVTGNRFTQRLLEQNVSASQRLMGISSGGGVNSSGEKAVFGLLRRKCLPPYCIFDVGSNQGQYLNIALRAFKDNRFIIHCFEPGSSAFQILKNNFAASGKLKLNNIALGKLKEEAMLYYDEPGSAIASLTKRRLDHFNISFCRSEAVKVDTLDNYCRENDIDKIHLLKLDVEGHEMDVLSGASDMFGKQAVEIVTFELGGGNIDTRTFFQNFFYFFKEKKMKICRITPSGYLYPVDSYKETFEQFRTTNFVATRDD